MFRLSPARVKFGLNNKLFLGLVDVEIFIVPDGFAGQLIQENLQQTELFFCIAILSIMFLRADIASDLFWTGSIALALDQGLTLIVS